MAYLRELSTAAGTLRSYHSISENLSRLVPLVLERMRQRGFADVFVADLIKDIGHNFASTKGGQQAMVQNALAAGVELNGYVLSIKTIETTSRYQKSKMVTCRTGTLESVLGPPDEATAPMSQNSRAAAPMALSGFEARLAALEGLRLGEVLPIVITRLKALESKESA